MTTARFAPVLLLALFTACDSPTDPPDEIGLLAAHALSLGDRHACALQVDGSAWCWGANGSGQLGNGTQADSPVPVRVSGGHAFVAISAGYNHTCARTKAGVAYCWGDNAFGQLGHSLENVSMTPRPVTGGIEFITVSATGHQFTCGVSSAGDVYCWGNGSFGRLGHTPVETCLSGQFTTPCSRAPARTDVGGRAAAVSIGFRHACALLGGGVATCWGDNTLGQLGGARSNTPFPPTPVAGVGFTALAMGAVHNCGLDDAARAWCWGNGEFGGLGSVTTPPSSAPVPVSGGLTFRFVAASLGNFIRGHSCGIALDERAYCWGADDRGQLGLGAAGGQQCGGTPAVACSTAPRAVHGTLRWSTVATGPGYSCGITTAGVAWCWGQNLAGRLGIGTIADVMTPTRVSNLSGLPRTSG